MSGKLFNYFNYEQKFIVCNLENQNNNLTHFNFKKEYSNSVTIPIYIAIKIHKQRVSNLLGSCNTIE